MSNPRSLFYDQPELARWHRELCSTDNFETAVTYALAEFSMFCPTREEMQGAQRFITLFRALSLKEETSTPDFGAPRLIPPELLGAKPSANPQPKT